MKVTVAKTAGFCFGVNRAVNLVKQLLREENQVCTLGPIIHNPQTLSQLRKMGVIEVEKPEEAPEGSTLVIRSHGVSKAVKEQIMRLPVRCVIYL